MDVLQAISTRRSHRSYQPTQLPEETLNAILRAALQSPSARNLQPWHFSVCQDQALLQEVNDEAAKVMNRSDFQIFYHAPTVIFIFGDTQNPWMPIDCGIAVQNIALSAEGLGIGSVILGLPKLAFQGDRQEELKQKFSCPPGYDFAIAIALGYSADTKDPHEAHEEKITRIS